MKIKLNSTQVVVEVQVRVELGNNEYAPHKVMLPCVLCALSRDAKIIFIIKQSFLGTAACF